MLAGVVCLFLCFLCSNSTISLQSRVRFNSCLTPFVLPTAEKNNPGKRYGAMETAPSLPEKCCPICVNFTAASIPLLLSHLHVVHSNEARFLMMCGIGGCSYTASSYSALYSHVYRNHPEAGVIKKRVSQDTASSALHASAATGGSAFLGDSDSYDIDLLTGPVTSADLQRLMGTDIETQRRSSALFLMKLKEHRRLSQVAVDDVVDGCRMIFRQTTDRLQAGIREKLAAIGIDSDDISLDDVFTDLVDPFDGLETQHKQEKYFKETLGLIEPQEIKVGDPSYVPQFSGTKRRLVQKWDTFQYIPLLPLLKKLLEDPSILAQIEQCSTRIHQNGIIEDFCDGLLFAKHELFSEDPLALQIIAFYDELELCNPLGSSIKKHKLGVIFFTLGNIHPKFRSQLRVINLSTVATYPIIEKHGLDCILKPFVQDLNVLSTTGLEVEIGGVKRTFRGALLAFLADNLASHGLGGFKMSFSFSFRSCRVCMATVSGYSSSFCHRDFEERTNEKHRKQCDELEGPLKDHYSKIYGVNRKSILLDVAYFSMFGGGLPLDAMHDILEGVAQYEIKLLLTHCISTCSYITLQEYNNRLQRFDFGYSQTDKPPPLTKHVITSDDKHLRMSASQVIVLARNLPFLIGDLVPEDHDQNWKCFLILLKIIQITTSNVSSCSVCAVLKLAIQEHHTMFVALYGATSLTPKMHFLIHYPQQILAVGPMVRTWNMRHEAKLSFFKRASHLGNFINIASTLANRHQRWLCYEMSSRELLHTALECGPVQSISVVEGESDSIKSIILGMSGAISLSTTISRPNWVKQNGIMYKKNNCFVVTGFDGLEPSFGRIDDILVLPGELVLFVVMHCPVIYFDDHYNAYVIDVSSQRKLIQADSLLDPFVLHTHKLFDKSDTVFISLKFYIF